MYSDTWYTNSKIGTAKCSHHPMLLSFMYLSFKFEGNSTRIGATMMFEKPVKQEKLILRKLMVKFDMSENSLNIQCDLKCHG